LSIQFYCVSNDAIVTVMQHGFRSLTSYYFILFIVNTLCDLHITLRCAHM